MRVRSVTLAPAQRADHVLANHPAAADTKYCLFGVALRGGTPGPRVPPGATALDASHARYVLR
jgi:hypothetical protein